MAVVSGASTKSTQAEEQNSSLLHMYGLRVLPSTLHYKLPTTQLRPLIGDARHATNNLKQLGRRPRPLRSGRHQKIRATTLDTQLREQLRMRLLTWVAERQTTCADVS